MMQILNVKLIQRHKYETSLKALPRKNMGKECISYNEDYHYMKIGISYQSYFY